jgi:O-antigen/teichoic acid export membrane protein
VDLGFLKIGLRLGLSIQLAYLVMSLAARIDVLFVYSLAGRAAAGRYSVSLTVGFLGAYASSALAFVLFPRLAQLGDADASKLALRASRVGIAASLTAAAVMAVIIPFVVPIVFGAPYRSSVVPALILLVGGILWAEQLLLARAQLARGNTRLQLTSFGLALIVMIGLDFLLIPHYGINGAAIASTVAPGVGLIVCLMAYRRLMGGALKLNALLPRREDFRLLVDFIRTILRGRLNR